MATTYKLLGQSNPAATTDTTLYTVPAATSALVSSITVCNTSTTTAGLARIAIRPAGAAIAAKHYVLFDLNMGAQNTQTFALGATLAATDVITVRASTGTFAFSAFGVELT